jgi:1-deoxyxylulose-5-phosphate synthase
MGYLSERYLGSAPADGRFTQWWAPGGTQWTDTQRALSALIRLARDHGQSLSEFAHSWLHYAASTVIGLRTLDQLHVSLNALDVQISTEARREVDRAVPPGTSLWFRVIERAHRSPALTVTTGARPG